MNVCLSNYGRNPTWLFGYIIAQAEFMIVSIILSEDRLRIGGAEPHDDFNEMSVVQASNCLIFNFTLAAYERNLESCSSQGIGK